MVISSEIDDFLKVCEILLSQAQKAVDSPKEFEKITENISAHFESNWAKFSSMLLKLNTENDLDDALKMRLRNVESLISAMENKAKTKNTWVNEFKEYIIKADEKKTREHLKVRILPMDNNFPQISEILNVLIVDPIWSAIFFSNAKFYYSGVDINRRLASFDE